MYIYLYTYMCVCVFKVFSSRRYRYICLFCIHIYLFIKATGIYIFRHIENGVM